MIEEDTNMKRVESEQKDVEMAFFQICIRGPSNRKGERKKRDEESKSWTVKKNVSQRV
jgi:hypothetical protein